MRRWNKIGINAGAHRGDVLSRGGALGIYTGEGVPWHIKGGGVLGACTTQIRGGGLRNVHSPKKWVLGNLSSTKRRY